MNKNKIYKTDQENFWAGEFGNRYIKRNLRNEIIINNIVLFSKIFSKIGIPKDIMEFGPNIGLNLVAIKTLSPNTKFNGVEINKTAAKELEKLKYVKVYNQSLLDFRVKKKHDLCFTCGVLIHLDPSVLNKAYDVLYRHSNKYILLIEYYNPTPAEVSYRGHQHRLFKRDFAGEILDKYKSKVKLIDYGFVYHKDSFPQDDITWFLLEKIRK